MTKVKDHLRSAEEFYALGTKECEEGRLKGNLTRMREGCEKVFHGERWEILDKIEWRRLIEIGDSAFLYLHQYGYYRGKMRPEVEKTIKDVKKAMDQVHKEIAHES